ncbi:MAG: hypothetical protein [Bacteriophage sp.]|nr:MAG: hypothetical protein [Bacteriophage sp.]
MGVSHLNLEHGTERSYPVNYEQSHQHIKECVKRFGGIVEQTAVLGVIPKTNNRKRYNNMTKRERQAFCNQICKEVYNDAIEELINTSKLNPLQPCKHKRLRSCSAVVFETEHYFILQSYRTPIAVIAKSTDTLYDAQRYVYGYTSTSAQHVSKFEKDYCRNKWNCEMRLTFRGI